MSMAHCQERWERDAASQQSPELSQEGHFVNNARETPLRAGTSMSYGAVRPPMTDVDVNVRPPLDNKSISDVAYRSTVVGTPRQLNPASVIVQLPQPTVFPNQYSNGDTVLTASTGGRAAVNYPPLSVEHNAKSVGNPVPSPVVPQPSTFEYYSSGTELDSVMHNVQHVADPQGRDQTVYQVNSTIAAIVRQYSTSSVDSIAANMECTGTAPPVCPTSRQVSQVLPARPHAEGARPIAREERVNQYPGETRAQYARVPTPQGSCDRPADPYAGNARQAAQAQRMNGHTPVLPANGVGRGQRAAPQEAPMNPVSNGFPQRLPQNIHGRQLN